MKEQQDNINTSRRVFLKQSSLLTVALLASRFPVWAKSIFSAHQPIHNIPEQKDIDPVWLSEIAKRGEPVKYLKTRNELSYIGMPVGGLHAGTVYLSGDGRLWLWQIYNETIEDSYEGVDPKTINWNDGTTVRQIRSRDGASYVEPVRSQNRRILEQGFAIRIKQDGKTIIKELNEESWEQVSFQSTYPMGTIVYHSPDVPVKVTLIAYSPFIPLDADRSSLPVTILRIYVENTSPKPLSVDVLGWMENGVNKLSLAQKINASETPNAGSQNGVTELVNHAHNHLNHDYIYFDCQSDNQAIQQATDAGSMYLMLHSSPGKVNTDCSPWPVTAMTFDEQNTDISKKSPPNKAIASIASSFLLNPNEQQQSDFSIGWHFNNPHPRLKELVEDAKQGYWYGHKFDHAKDLALYVSENFDTLTSLTEKWVETWQESTLPYWFLDRTILNIGTLATANTYRFASGRFWGWEGIGACAGTCTHVWQYAHAVGRIFPELERDLRERVDLGIAMEKDGGIIFRAENENRPAIDGQAGVILRCYREHQMSSSTDFLTRNWPQIKKAVKFIMAQDKNGDGMTDTPMENTLDAIWEGEIAWIVGLCIAAVRAAQEMATEMADTAFMRSCQDYVQKGKKNMEQHLFNGEYFIHRADSAQGRSKLGSYNTCHIDQVYGQSWALQVGLPRVLDKEKTISALKSLWKYNFTMDVGPYIKTHLGGRPYVLAGEGGMVMNTNPQNEENPYGDNVTWQMGYFHECMSGFEHQVAAHMMAEGMVEESLVLTRAIHDRYHAAKRNPYNEIECSDHYARAMASYGTFLSACGFEYHGPKGYMAFAPKMQPEDFKAAFTAAQGWGSYSQKLDKRGQNHIINVAHGNLMLRALKIQKLSGKPLKEITAYLNDSTIALDYKPCENNHIEIRFQDLLKLDAHSDLRIALKT